MDYSSKIVDIDNFEGVIKELPKLIKDSIVCSFDLEFSGIDSMRRDEVNKIDSIEMRYVKAKKSVTTFAVFSIGLTLFFKDNVSKSYDFLLFKNHKSFTNFTFNNKSMKMLNSLDFNRIFKRGIPYLNESEWALELAKLNKSKIDKIDISSNKYAQTYLKHVEKRVYDWYHNEKIEDFVYHEEKPKNDFFVKLLFDKFQFGENNTIFLESFKFDNGLKSVFFHKKKDANGAELDLLKKKTGFKRVIDLFKGYEKPFLGYNCLLDLCHIYEKFINPLPLDVNLFKEKLLSHFSHIIDVKHLVVKGFDNKFGKNKSLVNVFSKLFGKSGSSSFHTSSFDSFATGKVFFELLKLTGIGTDIINCVNKIFLIKKPINETFNLEASQIVDYEKMQNIVMLTKIPKNLSRKELESRVKTIWGKRSKFFTIDEQSGFVKVEKLKSLSILKGFGYNVEGVKSYQGYTNIIKSGEVNLLEMYYANLKLDVKTFLKK